MAETKGVDGDLAGVDLRRVTGGLTLELAVGHEEDVGGAGFREHAVGEDSQPQVKAGLDVGATVGNEGFDDSVELAPEVLGHGTKLGESLGAAFEGDDGEAVHGGKLHDHELQGLLDALDLVPSHAAAHVHHGHQVQALPHGGGGRRLDLHHSR
ncbi:Os12g0431850, partial [Oryza sativa Japonica Group]